MLELSVQQERAIHISRFCYKNLLEEYVPTLRNILNEKDQKIEIKKFSIRLKSIEAIAKKCIAKKLTFDTEKILQEIEDGAGIRIICSYVEETNEVIDRLKVYFKSLTFEEKRYEQHHIESCAHHSDFIVKVPISFLGKLKIVPLEIQLCSCGVA
ncbi:hypothetical protein ACYSNW_17540 [Enterococcus sp. LJL99]